MPFLAVILAGILYAVTYFLREYTFPSYRLTVTEGPVYNVIRTIQAPSPRWEAAVVGQCTNVFNPEYLLKNGLAPMTPMNNWQLSSTLYGNWLAEYPNLPILLGFATYISFLVACGVLAHFHHCNALASKPSAPKSSATDFDEMAYSLMNNLRPMLPTTVICNDTVDIQDVPQPAAWQYAFPDYLTDTKSLVRELGRACDRSFKLQNELDLAESQLHFARQVKNVTASTPAAACQNCNSLQNEYKQQMEDQAKQVEETAYAHADMIVTLEKQIQNDKVEKSLLNATIEDRENSVRSLQLDLRKKETNEKAVVEKLTRIQSDLNLARTECAWLKRDVRDARALLVKKQESVEELEIQMSNLDFIEWVAIQRAEAANRSRMNLARLKAEAETKSKEDIEDLGVEIEDLKAQLEHATNQVREKAMAKDDAEEKIDELKNENKKLQEEIQILREQVMRTTVKRTEPTHNKQQQEIKQLQKTVQLQLEGADTKDKAHAREVGEMKWEKYMMEAEMEKIKIELEELRASSNMIQSMTLLEASTEPAVDKGLVEVYAEKGASAPVDPSSLPQDIKNSLLRDVPETDRVSVGDQVPAAPPVVASIPELSSNRKTNLDEQGKKIQEPVIINLPDVAAGSAEITEPVSAQPTTAIPAAEPVSASESLRDSRSALPEPLVASEKRSHPQNFERSPQKTGLRTSGWATARSTSKRQRSAKASRTRLKSRLAASAERTQSSEYTTAAGSLKPISASNSLKDSKFADPEQLQAVGPSVPTAKSDSETNTDGFQTGSECSPATTAVGAAVPVSGLEPSTTSELPEPCYPAQQASTASLNMEPESASKSLSAFRFASSEKSDTVRTAQTAASERSQSKRSITVKKSELQESKWATAAAPSNKQASYEARQKSSASISGPSTAGVQSSEGSNTILAGSASASSSLSASEITEPEQVAAPVGPAPVQVAEGSQPARSDSVRDELKESKWATAEPKARDRGTVSAQTFDTANASRANDATVPSRTLTPSRLDKLAALARSLAPASLDTALSTPRGVETLMPGVFTVSIDPGQGAAAGSETPSTRPQQASAPAVFAPASTPLTLHPAPPQPSNRADTGDMDWTPTSPSATPAIRPARKSVRWSWTIATTSDGTPAPPPRERQPGEGYQPHVRRVSASTNSEMSSPRHSIADTSDNISPASSSILMFRPRPSPISNPSQPTSTPSTSGRFSNRFFDGSANGQASLNFARDINMPAPAPVPALAPAPAPAPVRGPSTNAAQDQHKDGRVLEFGQSQVKPLPMRRGRGRR